MNHTQPRVVQQQMDHNGLARRDSMPTDSNSNLVNKTQQSLSSGHFNPYQQFQHQHQQQQQPQHQQVQGQLGVQSIPLQQHQQQQPAMDHQQQFNQQQPQQPQHEYSIQMQQNAKQQQPQDDLATFQAPIHHPHPVHPHFTGYDINCKPRRSYRAQLGAEALFLRFLF